METSYTRETAPLAVSLGDGEARVDEDYTMNQVGKTCIRDDGIDGCAIV